MKYLLLEIKNIETEIKNSMAYQDSDYSELKWNLINSKMVKVLEKRTEYSESMAEIFRAEKIYINHEYKNYTVY